MFLTLVAKQSNVILFLIYLFTLGTKKFEDELYAEIRGRIKEDDISAPERKGPYYYYQRTLKGKEYVQHCRRLIPNCEAEAPLSVYDTMPTGPDAPPEHVILDENIKAQHHDYYSIAAFEVTKTMVYMIITDIAVVSCLIIQSSPLCCNCFSG